MIYILIIFWYGSSTSTSGKAALAVEFNSLEACQATSDQVIRTPGVQLALCAAKGKRP